MNILRVACCLSGGVDSSVAAFILKQKGYKVTGVFMRNWDIIDETGLCNADREQEDAEFVCRKLQIPFVQVNFVKEYWNNVFSELIREYENGMTPNPDILCNKKIKFGAFYDYFTTRLQQMDGFATGHYVNSSFGNYLENYEPNKGAKLLKAKDQNKDQTFFLSQIPQKALQHCMFPLGNLTKATVKKIAVDAGLEKIAKKREAQGTDHPALFNKSMIVEAPQWIHTLPEQLEKYGCMECDFRFQHRRPLVRCCVKVLETGLLHIDLETSLRALTCGQYAVLYLGDECLGSARIIELGPSLFELSFKQLNATSEKMS